MIRRTACKAVNCFSNVARVKYSCDISSTSTSTFITLVIVSRGDWLGKPANFKGPNNRVPAEVELTRHVTLTVHTTNKMADATNELFVFGDDFETILNMLEEDEAIEKHFSTTAIDVSIFYMKA